MKICLNMIVRNEAAIIENCLASVAHHVDCYVIGDTGSTDGTQAKIATFFEQRGIPGFIAEYAFHDFAQARNTALSEAEASALEFDYMLLLDADMTMSVNDAAWKDALEAQAYCCIQKTASGLEYSNARIVKRGVGARYKGVTHEYLAVTGAQDLPAVEFFDHACGSNRADKTERDARLLEQGLREEPDMAARYTFYLAQTYREMKKFEKARNLYARRAAMPEFEEEAWYAAVCEATCEESLGNEDEFATKMLAAWERRPWRAEPLYYLAAHYMRKQKHHLAATFAERGMGIEWPESDILFKERGIYDYGLRSIMAIAGFYVKDKRATSFALTNWLALSRDTPKIYRDNARQNIQHHLRPLSTYIDGWQSHEIDFKPPPGWHACNPSIANIGGYVDGVIRCVNYKVDFRPDGAHYVTPDGAAIMTRNFYARFNGDLGVIGAQELTEPDAPTPMSTAILGFEDMRLLEVDGSRFISATTCDRNKDGRPQIAIASIDGCAIENARVVEAHGFAGAVEKNWMPISGSLRYVHSCEPLRVIDGNGDIVTTHGQPIAADSFRGGTQLVPYEGGYLCAVHEVAVNQRERRRTYYHRFVVFDRDFNITDVSIPFVFNKPRFEFAAGLAWLDAKTLAISYGVDDCEAWVAKFPASELRKVLVSVEELREFA